MRRVATFAASLVVLTVLLAFAPNSQAQIMHPITADIHHSFIVHDTTLPPGRYIFRNVQLSNQTVMRVTSADGRTYTDFLVRASDDDHTPKHSELVLSRYANKEFLTHIYEKGNKTGVAVVDVSREEAELQQHGEHPATHTEEQTQ